MKTSEPFFVYIHPNHLNLETREFEKDPRTTPVGVVAVSVQEQTATNTVRLEVRVSRRFLGKGGKPGDKWDRRVGRVKALGATPMVAGEVPLEDLPKGSLQSDYVLAGLSMFLSGGGTKNRAFDRAVQDTYNRMTGMV